MERPDLTTLACVNPECQQFQQAGHGHLVIRKVYGRDRLRLLRCRICCEEFPNAVGARCSIPSFRRPQLRRSSIISTKAVACAPQPVWSRERKRRSLVCSGCRAVMPSAFTISMSTICAHWPWSSTNRGALAKKAKTLCGS